MLLLLLQRGSTFSFLDLTKDNGDISVGIRANVRSLYLTASVEEIKTEMRKEEVKSTRGLPLNSEKYMALSELLDEGEKHGVDSPADLPF